MMKTTKYQFDLGTWTDELREDAHALAKTLAELLPHADVYCESIKIDLSLLHIEISEVPT